jgi:hypothetical protein
MGLLRGKNVQLGLIDIPGTSGSEGKKCTVRTKSIFQEHGAPRGKIYS